VTVVVVDGPVDSVNKLVVEPGVVVTVVVGPVADTVEVPPGVAAGAKSSAAAIPTMTTTTITATMAASPIAGRALILNIHFLVAIHH